MLFFISFIKVLEVYEVFGFFKINKRYLLSVLILDFFIFEDVVNLVFIWVFNWLFVER